MFEGLLLSRDDHVIRLFRRIYQDLGMSLEVCTGADRAREELQRRKFDAVIVDCDDVEDAPAVLKSVHQIAANRNSTVFAILNGVTSMRAAFDMGANLTLPKPISLDHVRKSLLAMMMLLEQEHRRFHRVPVDFDVTLTFGETQQFQALATNLSEGGMALRMKESLPEQVSVGLRFTLPGMTQGMEMKAIIAWADTRGMAGVRFDYITPGAKQQLKEWLAHHRDPGKKEASESRQFANGVRAR